MTERKKCRFFHRWEDYDVYVDMFSIASKCRKCGLCRVTNLFTERVKYGWEEES